MSGSETFEEPTSPEEADSRRAELTSDVQDIQAQLGDKQRQGDDGSRLSSREYWTWKKRAQHALNQKLEELRAIKLWIKEHRQAAGNEWPATEAVTHVYNLNGILVEIQSDGVDLEDEAKVKIGAAQEFLRRTKTA